MQVEGIETNDLRDYLWNDHRIISVAINHSEFEGLRVSPSVYTTLPELDRFIDAVDGVARKGLPS